MSADDRMEGIPNAAPSEPRPRLSVVMPCYNEAATVRNVIEKVLRLSFALEITLLTIARRMEQPLCSRTQSCFPNVRVIRHVKNQGKTAALKTGFAATLGDIVIIQDADLEYDPDDIPDVIAPILNDKANVVYGRVFS